MIDLGPGAPGGGETNRFTVVCPYSNSDKQNSQHPMGEKNKQGDRDPSVGGGGGCNNLCRTPRRGSPECFCFSDL
jgi:hypothetical protein